MQPGSLEPCKAPGHRLSQAGRIVVLPRVDQPPQLLPRQAAPAGVDPLRHDPHAGRGQDQVPQVGPPQVGVPHRQRPAAGLAEDRRGAVEQTDGQADDARLPVNPREDAHEDHRHQRHGDGAGQAQVEEKHAPFEEGDVGEPEGEDEGHRDAPHLRVVGVAAPAHQEAGVDVAHEEGGDADADGVEGRVGRGHEPRHHQAHQTGGEVLDDHARIGLVDDLQARELGPGHRPECDVEEQADGGGQAGDDDGHLEVPLRARPEKADRLVLVDEDVRGEHDQETEDDQDGRHPLGTVPAHVEQPVGKPALHRLQPHGDAVPASHGGVDEPPQDEGGDDHGQALQGVREDAGAQAAADQVEGRGGCHRSDDDPAGPRGQPGDDVEDEEHGVVDVPQDVGP